MLEVGNLDQGVPGQHLVVLLHAHQVHRPVEVCGEDAAVAQPHQPVSFFHAVSVGDVDVPHRARRAGLVGGAVPQAEASGEAQTVGDGARRRGVFVIGDRILILQPQPGVDSDASKQDQNDQDCQNAPENPLLLLPGPPAVRFAHQRVSPFSLIQRASYHLFMNRNAVKCEKMVKIDGPAAVPLGRRSLNPGQCRLFSPEDGVKPRLPQILPFTRRGKGFNPLSPPGIPAPGCPAPAPSFGSARSWPPSGRTPDPSSVRAHPASSR